MKMKPEVRGRVCEVAKRRTVCHTDRPEAGKGSATKLDRVQQPGRGGQGVRGIKPGGKGFLGEASWSHRHEIFVINSSGTVIRIACGRSPPRGVTPTV